ncbi:MAG: LysM peptidoglycan-binding domain-containing protein [Bacteroidia bacterium]|jgi:LysM repeat protein|nr:LysM peptidoglycan-binding domain-containing protein [Bacteroidia bacterium]
MKNLITTIVLLTSIYSYGHKTDSIGTRVKNGITYIIHKVEKGDGLYSLSRKYNVNIKSLIDENPGSSEVIKIDQLIWIPTDVEPVLEEKVVRNFFNGNHTSVESIDEPMLDAGNQVSTFARYHKVIDGETLYSISSKYNTSVEMIKNLNNMSLDNISVGQRILVQDGKAKTVYMEDKQNDSVSSTKIRPYKDLGFDTKVETKTLKNNDYSIKIEKLKEYDIEKVEESGIALVGDSKLPENKNFALHFNAPIGQVIMVTNPKNKKTVFVKIIGNFLKLESSSEIIKLSLISASSIGIEDKDKVTLSYAIAR